MTDKEKLIELIMSSHCPETEDPFGDHCESCEYYREVNCHKIVLADHLIANGVTVRNKAHWIIHRSGKTKDAPKYAECSNCRVTGSPQWKSCPVCDSLMEG